MIYKFKLVSDEAENFSRAYEIDADASFLDLRKVILESVGYNVDSIDSFFICDTDWSRQQEIMLEDMGTSSDTDLYLMKDTVIGDIIEDEGQRLVFVFDYITDRCFFMELKDTLPGQHLEKAVCTDSKGNPPAQTMDLEEFDKSVDAAMGSALDMGIFDDEFNEGYNDDDFNGLENIGADQL